MGFINYIINYVKVDDNNRTKLKMRKIEVYFCQVLIQYVKWYNSTTQSLISKRCVQKFKVATRITKEVIANKANK